jgi:hypothetical protein
MSLAVIFLMVLIEPSLAGRCDNRVPYYHGNPDTGPGSVLADLLLFPFSLGVTVLTVPVYHRTGNGSVTGDAACMPVALLRHAAGYRQRRASK